MPGVELGKGDPVFGQAFPSNIWLRNTPQLLSKELNCGGCGVTQFGVLGWLVQGENNSGENCL